MAQGVASVADISWLFSFSVEEFSVLILLIFSIFLSLSHYQKIGLASYHLPLNSSTQDAEAGRFEFELSQPSSVCIVNCRTARTT